MMTIEFGTVLPWLPIGDGTGHVLQSSAVDPMVCQLAARYGILKCRLLTEFRGRKVLLILFNP